MRDLLAWTLRWWSSGGAVLGPYEVAARELYQTGQRAGELPTSGRAAGEQFVTGVVAGEVSR